MKNSKVERQRKRIKELVEQNAKFKKENESLRQECNDRDEYIRVLTLELADARVDVFEYIDQLEQEISEARQLKNKYKSLISSMREKRAFYEKEMKSMIKESKKEIK